MTNIFTCIQLWLYTDTIRSNYSRDLFLFPLKCWFYFLNLLNSSLSLELNKSSNKNKKKIKKQKNFTSPITSKLEKVDKLAKLKVSMLSKSNFDPSNIFMSKSSLLQQKILKIKVLVLFCQKKFKTVNGKMESILKSKLSKRIFFKNLFFFGF